MGFPWKGVFSIAISMLDVILPGVRSVEAIARSFPALKGKDKQNAVVEMVRQSLDITEGALGRDLANDEDVLAATRGVIDATVALHNIVAEKVKAAA
jgi:hypothetical protein